MNWLRRKNSTATCEEVPEPDKVIVVAPEGDVYLTYQPQDSGSTRIRVSSEVLIRKSKYFAAAFNGRFAEGIAPKSTDAPLSFVLEEDPNLVPEPAKAMELMSRMMHGTLDLEEKCPPSSLEPQFQVLCDKYCFLDINQLYLKNWIRPSAERQWREYLLSPLSHDDFCRPSHWPGKVDSHWSTVSNKRPLTQSSPNRQSQDGFDMPTGWLGERSKYWQFKIYTTLDDKKRRSFKLWHKPQPSDSCGSRMERVPTPLLENLGDAEKRDIGLLLRYISAHFANASPANPSHTFQVCDVYTGKEPGHGDNQDKGVTTLVLRRQRPPMWQDIYIPDNMVLEAVQLCLRRLNKDQAPSPKGLAWEMGYGFQLADSHHDNFWSPVLGTAEQITERVPRSIIPTLGAVF